jgi:hypothetical protein
VRATANPWHSYILMSERQQGKALPEGLYEALLTQALRNGLPATTDLYTLERLEAADAPGFLRRTSAER